jgi:hypothetical protein
MLRATNPLKAPGACSKKRRKNCLHPYLKICLNNSIEKSNVKKMAGKIIDIITQKIIFNNYGRNILVFDE